MRFVLPILAILFAAHIAFGQYYGAIRVDQRGLSQDYQIVKKYRLQIESSISYMNDTDIPGAPNLEEQQLNLAQTLLRFGLSKRFELRMGSQVVYRRQKLFAWKHSVTTVGGMFVGAKWQFLQHKKGFLPNASFLARVDLPVGSKEIVSSKVEPQGGIVASHPLSEAARLNYNLLVSYRDQSNLEYFYAAQLVVDFSPQTSAFIEFAAIDPDNARGQIIFDGGLTLLAKRNLMFTIYGGKGLNNVAPDWFVRFGAGIRLPR